MEGVTARRQITLSRRVYNEQEFKKCYVPKQSSKKGRTPAQKLRKHLCENISNLTCKGILFSWLPILTWLPKYSIKDNVIADIAGGLTVAVLHIPQGISLVWIPAVYALKFWFIFVNFRFGICYVSVCTSYYRSLSCLCTVTRVCVTWNIEAYISR